MRRKLSSALSQWNPLDSSAFYVVQPWGGVFDERAMHDFLLHSIVPKLVMSVRDQVVEPRGQNTQHLAAVLMWSPLLPTDDMVSLLEGEFFPRWFGVLAGWLSSPGVALVDVADWYRTWRGVFPEDVAALPVVTHYFSEALEMMSAAMASPAGGTYSPPPSLSQGLDYFQLVDKRKAHQRAARKLEALGSGSSGHGGRLSGSGGGGNNGDPTFKEVVEAFALQHGVTFLPKRSAGGAPMVEDGQTLWVFGDRVTCYLDQNVVYARKGGSQGQTYQPVGLDTLLQMR